MTSLHNFYNEIRSTNSINEKKAILTKYKDDDSVQWFLKLSNCPSYVFNFGDLTYPDYQPTGENKSILNHESVDLIFEIANRNVTGNEAIARVQATQNKLDPVSAEIFKGILTKNPKIKVGAKTINGIIPKLIIDVPYQQCSLINDSIRTKIDACQELFVQLKGDGVFGALACNHNGEVNLFTRNGSIYPTAFSSIFSLGNLTNYVIEGELVWFDGDKPLDRATSNGISNSVEQGGDIPTKYTPKFLVWNLLSFDEWENHKSTVTYKDRFAKLNQVLTDNPNQNVEVIENYVVATFQECIALTTQFIGRGLEGAIVKLPYGLWAYNKSTDAIKLKVAVEVDMEIVSIEEATEKNVGMAGRINVRSSDGKIECGINANGTDAERRDLWLNRDKAIGKIIPVTCNDVVAAQNEETLSLYLGRAQPSAIRTDKTVADDLERIVEIFEGAHVNRRHLLG